MTESNHQIGMSRCLLLTDVVDSTKVAQALGDAEMAKHWAAHDRAARDLLPVWRGREIDKTDGVLILFDGVADAAGYALAYHRALATLGLPFKARVGLHFGAVTLRANSAADIALGAKPFDVDGLATPITARVMSVAQAGQTLLTQDAYAQIGDTAMRVLSHGHWRLKGLPEPVELFEIGDADSLFTPPPDEAKAYRVVQQAGVWQPVRDIQHNVPAERDCFVGRREPLLALARKFEEGARLVSVLGIGGTGKTRLATRFASMWLGEFPGGVLFCDLSQARTVDGILLAVGQGLELRLNDSDPIVQITQAIARRGNCLVILDNFEQVARHAESTLGAMLNRAPLAKFMVTTREVLGVVGEEILALAPLSTSDAVGLFLRRAESAKRGVEFSAVDLLAIQKLVNMLDGLPLAIELAAARVRVMTPSNLLARMNERFSVLWSSAGRQDRQATLRAAFDWSWDLLNPSEMAALAQLSVFEGGFTLQSAQGVLALDADTGPLSVVDVVGLLIDKSFVRQLDNGRFDLLESVREYAAEHLRTTGRYAGSGEHAASAARARHWRYFSGLDERAATADRGVEVNNLVVACQRATAAGDAASAVGALTGAWCVLSLTGPFRAGVELAANVADMAGINERQRAEIDLVAAGAFGGLGQIAEARIHLDSGIALALLVDHRPGEVRLRLTLASQQVAQGQLEQASSNLTRALAMVQALSDRSLQCKVLLALGGLADRQARYEQARGHYASALVIAREIGDRRMEGGLLGNLGGLHHEQGRLEEACQHYEQALVLAWEVGDRRWEGNARCNLGLVHQEQGNSSKARNEFQKALALAIEVGHVRLQGTVLCNLGIVLEANEEFREATEAYSQAVAVANGLRDLRLEGQFRSYLGLLHARQNNFAEARDCLAKGESMLLESEDTVSLALLLCARAEAEYLAGDPATAIDCWQRACQLALQTSADANSELGRALKRLKTILEQVPAS
jgi:predicted ATPase/class 3 adenylate cyclase/Tfp pilus assembly protein PilF